MGLERVSAEGGVAPPDRLQAEVRAKAMGSVSVTVNVVGIGERAWVTNPFTRQWQGERGGGIGGNPHPARGVVGGAQGGARRQANGGRRRRRVLACREA